MQEHRRSTIQTISSSSQYPTSSMRGSPWSVDSYELVETQPPNNNDHAPVHGRPQSNKDYGPTKSQLQDTSDHVSSHSDLYADPASPPPQHHHSPMDFHLHTFWTLWGIQETDYFEDYLVPDLWPEEELDSFSEETWIALEKLARLTPNRAEHACEALRYCLEQRHKFQAMNNAVGSGRVVLKDIEAAVSVLKGRGKRGLLDLRNIQKTQKPEDAVSYSEDDLEKDSSYDFKRHPYHDYSQPLVPFKPPLHDSSLYNHTPDTVDRKEAIISQIERTWQIKDLARASRHTTSTTSTSKIGHSTS